MKVDLDANDERKVESGNPDNPEHELNMDAPQQKDTSAFKRLPRAIASNPKICAWKLEADG